MVSGHKTLRHVIQKLTRTSHSQQLTAFAKKHLCLHRSSSEIVQLFQKLVQTKQRHSKVSNCKTKTKSQYSPFRLLKFSASHFPSLTALYGLSLFIWFQPQVSNFKNNSLQVRVPVFGPYKTSRTRSKLLIPMLSHDSIGFGGELIDYRANCRPHRTPTISSLLAIYTHWVCI